MKDYLFWNKAQAERELFLSHDSQNVETVLFEQARRGVKVAHVIRSMTEEQVSALLEVMVKFGAESITCEPLPAPLNLVMFRYDLYEGYTYAKEEGATITLKSGLAIDELYQDRSICAALIEGAEAGINLAKSEASLEFVLVNPEDEGRIYCYWHDIDLVSEGA